MIPQFQDIVDKSGKKGNFGGWLSVRMNLGERPVICLGQYEAIFKKYIFTKKMWTHKGKCFPVTKEKVYGIMILSFQYQDFGFEYTLTVLYLQTIIYYLGFHPKYVDIDTATTILGNTEKETITMVINNF